LYYNENHENGKTNLGEEEDDFVDGSILPS